MFTGIIEEIGEVLAVAPSGDGTRLTVRAPLAVSDARHGDSIAISGVCLTVVDQDAATFTADVMRQTLDMSTLGALAAGSPVNVERATSVGDRLGGHIVQGHVDGTGTVIEVRPGDQWQVVRIALPAHLAPLVVDKGSIAVDGVSLTVSAVSPAPSTSSGTSGGSSGTSGGSSGTSGGSSGTSGGDSGTSAVQEHWFEVSLIPETLAATTLGSRAPGDAVNLETDILARHVQRMLAFTTPEGGSR